VPFSNLHIPTGCSQQSDASLVSKDSSHISPYSVPSAKMGYRWFDFPETVINRLLVPVAFAFWCYPCQYGKKDFAAVIKVTSHLTLKQENYYGLFKWT
jgi:hypothetical protein